MSVGIRLSQFARPAAFGATNRYLDRSCRRLAAGGGRRRAALVSLRSPQSRKPRTARHQAAYRSIIRPPSRAASGERRIQAMGKQFPAVSEMDLHLGLGKKADDPAMTELGVVDQVKHPEIGLQVVRLIERPVRGKSQLFPAGASMRRTLRLGCFPACRRYGVRRSQSMRRSATLALHLGNCAVYHGTDHV